MIGCSLSGLKRHMHTLTNCCNSVINHGNGLKGRFWLSEIYQPQKVVKARPKNWPAYSNLSPQGLLLFACLHIGHKTCSHIGHKTYMTYSDMYVLHNISVFNQCKHTAAFHFYRSQTLNLHFYVCAQGTTASDRRQYLVYSFFIRSSSKHKAKKSKHS